MSQQIYMNYIHPSSLLKQLSVLWRTDQLCDAVITIDKVIVAKAHKLVLFAISPKLKREHSLSQQSSILQVDLPSGISSSSAEAFLQYMYEGFLVLTEPLVRDLSRIAKHLDIQCLIKCCNDYQSKLDAGTLHKPETEFDDEAVNTSADFPHVRRFCVKNNKNAAGVNSSNFGPQAKRSRIMSPNVKETLDVRKKQTDGDGPGNSTPTSEGQSKQNSFPQFIVKTTSRQNTDQGSTDPRICKIEVAERSTCSYDSDARESQSTQHTVYSHSSIPPSSQASKETFEGNESLKNIKTEPEEIDDDCEISGVTMADNSYSYAHDTQQSDYSHSDLDQSDMMRFEVSAAPPSDLNESYMNEHSMNISDTGQDASVQPGSSRLNANETYMVELDTEKYETIFGEDSGMQTLSRPCDVGDTSGAVLYDRHPAPMSFEKVYNILKNPDPDKVIKFPPNRPVAGSVYLFSAEEDARQMNRWKRDQYFWMHNGRKVKREQDEQIAKIYHKTKTGPECGSLKFIRHAYHFLSNPYLVLVHYIGDEKVYVPYSSMAQPKS